MLDNKEIVIETRSKGNKELVSNLLRNDVKAIAENFKQTYNKVYQVLYGRSYGDNEIVQCAVEMANTNKRLSEEKKQILKRYAKSN